MNKPYYTEYEKRYQTAFSAGAERWGYSPNDEVLCNTLKSWVEENGLKGKSIIEYACGEGACGVILSELGCIYHGVDISPSAIEKAKIILSKYPCAKVEVLDMVKECVKEKYDAALDCMGLHMLVTDDDRKNYLQNVYNTLTIGSPMFLFRELYSKDGAYNGFVSTIEEWTEITGYDYKTPQLRHVRNEGDGRDIEVFVPLLPARPKDMDGYTIELEDIGFNIEKFVEMDIFEDTAHSINIYVRKTN